MLGLKAVGFDDDSSIVVDADHRVVLIRVPKGLAITEQSVEPFPIPPGEPARDFGSMTQVFCGRFMAEGPDGHTTNSVLKASGLCGDRERNGGTGSPE